MSKSEKLPKLPKEKKLPKVKNLSDSKTPSSKPLKKKKNDQYIETKIVVEKPELLPLYSSPDAVCVDLYAIIPDTIDGMKVPAQVVLSHRSSLKIRTGIQVEIPEGYKLCVSARNELAEKGLIVTNAPAQTCKGEVKVLVHNIGRELVEIKNGDKIAQCWIEPVYKFTWKVVSELSTGEV